MKKVYAKIPNFGDPYEQYYIKYYPKCGNYYLMRCLCGRDVYKRWRKTSLNELVCIFGFFHIAGALRLTFNDLYIRTLKGSR